MPRSYNSVTQQTLHYLIRPHDGVPSGPIETPAAWRGAELEKDRSWRDALSGLEVEEISEALACAKRTERATRDLTARDFPLRTLAGRVQSWRRAVARGRGVQVITGLPVADWTTEDAEIVFWCLGQHLGTPGVQNRDGEILGHVRDLGVSYDDPSVRGYKTAAHLSYHCDAADAVGLLCLSAARIGGRSRFVSSVTVFNELMQRRPDLVSQLFEPMLLDTRGDGGLNFFPIQPCRHFEGELRTFYHGDYYRTASSHPGAPPLTDTQRELLQEYESIAKEPGIYLEMDFAPGDIQLLSNHTVLHSRTAYVDWEDPQEKRHLLRLWLSFEQHNSPRGKLSQLREAARLLGELTAGRMRDRFLS